MIMERPLRIRSCRFTFFLFPFVFPLSYDAPCGGGDDDDDGDVLFSFAGQRKLKSKMQALQ